MNLKHWFLPNRMNKFHPVALRPVGLLIFLAIFVAIAPVYNIITAGKPQVLGYATNINVGDLFNISNQERINNGLPALSLNTQLSSAALAKANDMFADNYWAHVAPDGTTPWSFILASGYDYTSAGENLAKDFSTSAGVVNGWMGSPSHRANVLNSNYADVGYAVVNGVLLGSETTLVVAEYGQPVQQTVASTTPASEEQPLAPQEQQESAPTYSQPQEPSPSSVQDESSQTESQTQTETVALTETNTNTESSDTTITETPKNEPISTKTKDKNIATDTAAVLGAVISVPLTKYISLNWGQKASLLLASTIILLFIMKHTLVWREQKRGVKNVWLRAHPLGQVAVLVVAIIVTFANGVGVVL